MFAGLKREEEERRAREEEETRKLRQEEMKRSLGTSTKEYLLQNTLVLMPFQLFKEHKCTRVELFRGGAASRD